METVHPAEDDTAATIVSERYQIQTANQKYDCRGCYCTSLAFTGFNTGEIPQVTAQINPSYWFPENTSTWPTATSVDSFTPAPVSAGSFFIQTVGTTTRNLLNVRDVQFNVDLQVVPLMGPGGNTARQAVIGVRRVRCQSSITFTVDSDAPGTDVLGDIWTGTDLKHILYTLSAEDGSAMAIYMPNAKAVQVRPTQHDRNGVNCKTITMLGLTGPWKILMGYMGAGLRLAMLRCLLRFYTLAKSRRYSRSGIFVDSRNVCSADMSSVKVTPPGGSGLKRLSLPWVHLQSSEQATCEDTTTSQSSSGEN
jgi:hypothetical protein